MLLPGGKDGARVQQRAVWGDWHLCETWRRHQLRGRAPLLPHEGHQGIARGGHRDDAGGHAEVEVLLVLSCGCGMGGGAAAAEAVVGVVVVLREVTLRCSRGR